MTATRWHIDPPGLRELAIIAGSALLMLVSDALTWLVGEDDDCWGDE